MLPTIFSIIGIIITFLAITAFAFADNLTSTFLKIKTDDVNSIIQKYKGWYNLNAEEDRVFSYYYGTKLFSFIIVLMVFVMLSFCFK